MMIHSMKTKMPLQSTGMAEILLPYEGNLDTFRNFKIECQSNCAAMSGRWYILAVIFLCHLIKLHHFVPLNLCAVSARGNNIWCIWRFSVF